MQQATSQCRQSSGEEAAAQVWGGQTRPSPSASRSVQNNNQEKLHQRNLKRVKIFDVDDAFFFDLLMKSPEPLCFEVCAEHASGDEKALARRFSKTV